MADLTNVTRGLCPAPFFQDTLFTDGGFLEGRICQEIFPDLRCCLPCPLHEWAYPDSFQTMTTAANWVSVASTICCVFLLISWAVLPVEKTYRHYLSICLTFGVMFMSLGFVIPLAGNPDQCYDAITPNSMKTNSTCAASGFFLIMGGWAGVLWVFLRALSLHLQICWQLVVGRNFMWFSQIVGWGIPAVGITLVMLLSGVSFRFGQTCHINHKNSLADLWIPLLVFAGFTLLIQFSTFGYCIKVYLASLSDNGPSTEGSGLPSYTNSIRTMTPKQAYRRVRRVISLQWRGIAIVLIIITDVVFFSIVFVFLDNTLQTVVHNQKLAEPWVRCLAEKGGKKDECLDHAGALSVNIATVGAVLFLLAMNGIWLLLLLGRWTMVTGWRDLFTSGPSRSKREFVSVDARLDDLKKDTRSYEMLSRDTGETMGESVTPISVAVTPISPAARMRSPIGSPIGGHRSRQDQHHRHHRDPSHDDDDDYTGNDGRRTPDYFGQTARYHTPVRSFSSPRPPQTVTWDARETYARPTSPYGAAEQQQQAMQQQDRYVNPLGLNRI